MKSLTPYYRWLLFIGCLATLSQLIQYHTTTPVVFLHSYVDDILAMPILLGIWRWEQQHYWGISYLTNFQITAFTIVIFVLFESVIPHFVSGFTADWWDGVAYLAGSAVFWGIQERFPTLPTTN